MCSKMPCLQGVCFSTRGEVWVIIGLSGSGEVKYGEYGFVMSTATYQIKCNDSNQYSLVISA